MSVSLLSVLLELLTLLRRSVPHALVSDGPAEPASDAAADGDPDAAAEPAPVVPVLITFNGLPSSLARWLYASAAASAVGKSEPRYCVPLLYQILASNLPLGIFRTPR